MIHNTEINKKELHIKIRQQEICFGGNKKLKIYVKLECTSGKKMKQSKRVFFAAAKEAVKEGYRPCGHCMKMEYKKWKVLSF